MFMPRASAYPDANDPQFSIPIFSDFGTTVHVKKIQKKFRNIPPCLDGYLELLRVPGNHPEWTVNRWLRQEICPFEMIFWVVDYYFHANDPFEERRISTERLFPLLPDWCALIELTRVENEEELLVFMELHPHITFRSPFAPYHWGPAGKKTLAMGHLSATEIFTGTIKTVEVHGDRIVALLVRETIGSGSVRVRVRVKDLDQRYRMAKTPVMFIDQQIYYTLQGSTYQLVGFKDL